MLLYPFLVISLLAPVTSYYLVSARLPPGWMYRKCRYTLSWHDLKEWEDTVTIAMMRSTDVESTLTHFKEMMAIANLVKSKTLSDKYLNS